MTPDELKGAADRVAKYVQKNDYVTFLQIGRLLDEAKVSTKGDLGLEIAPNVILWSGVSQDFLDVVNDLLRRKVIHWQGASESAYIFDGGFLELPIAKSVPSEGYAKPHWLPVSFRPGPVPRQAKKGGRR